MHPVRVYDSEGVLFYYNRPYEGALTFNLPKGSYKIYEDELYLLKEIKPLQYELPYLDKATAKNKIKIPENFTHYMTKNPAKCSIDLKEGAIIWDEEFAKGLGKLGRSFIALHELGHYMYNGSPEDEQRCDTFARYHMLKRGYNPSQIAAVSSATLGTSHLSDKRNFKALKDAKNADTI